MPVIALIGDIGGTNVRLSLKRLNLQTRTSDDIIPLTKFKAQDQASVHATIMLFLKDITALGGTRSKNRPTVGAIGLAGEVKDGRASVTNVPHWPKVDEIQIQQFCNIKSFKLLNDFAAFGLGIDLLMEKDVIYLNNSPI